MSVASSRTLHVRCSTWDQVEAFHTRKLRRGKLLSMKVPFQPDLGARVTIGLELPNSVVIAIDAVVQKAAPVEGDTKTWIELELVGFTEDVVARIRAMQAGTETASAPTPVVAAPASRLGSRASEPSGPTGDEQQHFQQLTTELRRMRQLAVHEVLGVAHDADAAEIRRGWMELVRHYHPDLVARHQAPAITHLAEELTILVNRAYDRLRVAMVAEGRATSAGSALQQPPGWFVGFDDIASTPSSRTRIPAAQPAPQSLPTAPSGPATAGAAATAVQGAEAFEVRARAMLGEGNADNAQEVLAAALCVYPRSRPLRSLYYVASALGALEKGEIMLATSQLETAFAHYDQCTEAATLLEHVRAHGSVERDAMRRLFQ